MIKNYVLHPLSMDNSTYQINYGPHYTSTYGNDDELVPVDTLETANVAHTFKTNAIDYARFIIALTDGTGLTKATFKGMFSSQVTTDICQTSKAIQN